MSDGGFLTDAAASGGNVSLGGASSGSGGSFGGSSVGGAAHTGGGPSGILDPSTGDAGNAALSGNGSSNGCGCTLAAEGRSSRGACALLAGLAFVWLRRARRRSE
jgi:hypothetical protein